MSDTQTQIRSLDGSEPTLTAVGDLDFRCAQQFVDSAETLLSRHDHVILDLEGVTFADSSGIAALLAVRQSAEKMEKRLEIRGVGTYLGRALQMAGLAFCFGLAPLPPRQDRDPLMSQSELHRADWLVTESVVVGRPVLVAGLRDSAVEAARQAGLSKEEVSDVKLAVGEALANALKHGLQPRRDKIRLRCMSCYSAFVVEVSDQGVGFDPDGLSLPEPQELQPGGLGIRMMRSTMDEVDFIFDGSGSKVRMLKWIGSRE